MKEFTVKDLMVPLSEYATVPEGATLFEAVLALEKAQEEFDHTKYRHRSILVMNQNQEVIGKISQLDVLKALEPADHRFAHAKELSRYGFSNTFVRNLHKHRRLQKAPLSKLCVRAAQVKVEACMQHIAEGEYIDQHAGLDAAIQHLLIEKHISLLVTKEKKIVGILRLSDVFAAVFHAMKKCEITSS